MSTITIIVLGQRNSLLEFHVLLLCGPRHWVTGFEETLCPSNFVTGFHIQEKQKGVHRCESLQTRNPLLLRLHSFTDFYEIWYYHYFTEYHQSAVHCNFL